MAAGLAELDRWLDDRLRTGLADPALARYRTWDDLAARLIDAQVGGLANRVRRLAGVVGAHPEWHEQVLAELGVLHLLATGGRRLGALPPGLADSVAAAIGWQVRQADVLAGVPHTDHWVVMGRSDVREDRIEVRRVWLRGPATGEWAMVLSFAAYRQTPRHVAAGGHRACTPICSAIPGALGLRCSSVAATATRCRPARSRRVGWPRRATRSARPWPREPWLERYPVCVLAAPARAGGRWVLTDQTARCRSPTASPASARCWRAARVAPLPSRPSGPRRAWCRSPPTSPIARSTSARSPTRRSWGPGMTRPSSSTGTRWSRSRCSAPTGATRRRRPTGGLADLAADAPQPTPSQRLLQQVAACTVVRRAGVLPGPPVAPPWRRPPPTRGRSRPPSATATWRRVVADWPVLEDEWVLAVVRSGRRLAPELVPPLLARHRTDATRHARVLAAAGPLGQWMIDWSPRLACTAEAAAGGRAPSASCPSWPSRPSWSALLTAPPARGRRACVAGGLADGALPHQPPGRARQPARPHATRLAAGRSPRRSTASTRRRRPSGSRSRSADLAHLRHHMLTELEPA